MSLNEFQQLMLEVQVMCFARVYGLFVSGDVTTDVNECAEDCNALDSCHWFTYNSEDQSCVLTSDRELVSDCPTCTYGHDGCIQEGSSGMILSFPPLFLRHLCISTCLEEVLKLPVGKFRI